MPKRDFTSLLAHAFGRMADYVRGHPVSITAIEREEESERKIRELRARRELAEVWLRSHGLRFRIDKEGLIVVPDERRKR